MNNKDKKIFETLKALAISSEGIGSSRHAAVIMRRGKIVSFGVNSTKSHPFQKQYSRNSNCIYFHAETHSIYNALKNISIDELAKCDIYVLRVIKNGTVSESCPCIGCKKAIAAFNIKNVFYSDNTGSFKSL
jgi:deoxycytidylate deaminase